jgi:hypothetical protein
VTPDGVIRGAKPANTGSVPPQNMRGAGAPLPTWLPYVGAALLVLWLLTRKG